MKIPFFATQALPDSHFFTTTNLKFPAIEPLLCFNNNFSFPKFALFLHFFLCLCICLFLLIFVLSPNAVFPWHCSVFDLSVFDLTCFSFVEATEKEITAEASPNIHQFSWFRVLPCQRVDCIIFGFLSKKIGKSSNTRV